MKRIDFIKKTILLPTLGVSAYAGEKKTENNKSNSIKFSVFSDLHYLPNDFNWATKRLEDIITRAKNENSEFIIHCGDFCHNVVSAKRALDIYHNAPMPVYHTIGNHEIEITSQKMPTILKAFRLENNFYTFDKGNFRFVVFDKSEAKRS